MMNPFRTTNRFGKYIPIPSFSSSPSSSSERNESNELPLHTSKYSHERDTNRSDPYPWHRSKVDGRNHPAASSTIHNLSCHSLLKPKPYLFVVITASIIILVVLFIETQEGAPLSNASSLAEIHTSDGEETEKWEDFYNISRMGWRSFEIDKVDRHGGAEQWAANPIWPYKSNLALKEGSANSEWLSDDCVIQWVSTSEVCPELLPPSTTVDSSSNSPKVFDLRHDSVSADHENGSSELSQRNQARYPSALRAADAVTSHASAYERMKAQSKIDVVYTYTNGSDDLLQIWRKKVAGLYDWGDPSNHMNSGDSITNRKRFREYDEIRYSIRSLLASFSYHNRSNDHPIGTIHLITTDLPLYLPGDNATEKTVPTQSKKIQKGGQELIGQVPTWLNISTLSGDKAQHIVNSTYPALRVIHHSTFFGTNNNKLETVSDETSLWKTGPLPTFNSLAIESQIPNLEGVADHFMYMNDDVFTMTPTVSPADTASPLLGPVFLLQRNLRVNGISDQDNVGDSTGEWASLKRSNWLLNRRFGERNRPYLAHMGKAFFMPLLREASLIWIEELRRTSHSRFRGQLVEFQLPFLVTHYIIESHRQALLWSFFVAKSDQGGDGVYSWSERQLILSTLAPSPLSKTVTQNTPTKSNEGDAKMVETGYAGHIPIRSSLSTINPLFERLEMEPPKAFNMTFDSRDGFASFYVSTPPLPGYYPSSPKPGANNSPTPTRVWTDNHWPVLEAEDDSDSFVQKNRVCSFEVPKCLGFEFDIDSAPEGKDAFTANDVFKRVAFEHPDCGDCAILLLMSKSGSKGLETFLPEPISYQGGPRKISDHGIRAVGKAQVGSMGVEAFSFKKDWIDIDFSLLATSPGLTRDQLRIKCARLIHRYAYTIGNAPSLLVVMRQPLVLITLLSALSPSFAKKYGRKMKGKAAPPPTFLTLNDDVKTEQQSSIVRQLLIDFFKLTWTRPSPYELQDSIT